MEWLRGQEDIEKEGHTFSLDLVTLGEGEVRSKKVVVVDLGHCRRGDGVEEMKWSALKGYPVDRYLSNGV